MSPWTVIGWCLAIVVAIGTMFVVGTAVGALIGFITVWRSPTDAEQQVIDLKKQKGIK